MSEPAKNRPKRVKLPHLRPAGEVGLSAWLAMVRVYGRMERLLEQSLEPHGLTLAQFELLVVLGMSEGLTQQALAGRLLVTKGNICALVDRLERAALVERRPDPDDRRANRLFLKDSGRRILAETFPAHHAVVEEVMGALSLPDRQKLHDLLDRLDDALG